MQDMALRILDSSFVSNMPFFSCNCAASKYFVHSGCGKLKVVHQIGFLTASYLGSHVKLLYVSSVVGRVGLPGFATQH